MQIKFRFNHWSKRKKILFLFALLLLVSFIVTLPKKLFNATYSTVLYDYKNRLLAAQIAPDGQWRFPCSDSIPLKFEKCILQFEDNYFYYHLGINPMSLGKALYSNFKNKKIKRGGSTITMQLARLSRGNQSRSYDEKLIEMLLAFRIECAYSKKSILNLYVGNAPFGGNVVGLEAASWRYFGRDPYKLSWAECAMLAVLPNAPSLIYPGKNHNSLLKKRNKLLQKLLVEKIIDTVTYELAIKETLPEKPYPLPQIATHLLQRSIAENGNGQSYYSTINKEIQLQAVDIVERYAKQLKANLINNTCAIIADTKSGEVLAYIGNTTASVDKDNNAVDILKSKRSPGSILKPLLYASLINDGRISPSAYVEDIPMQIGAYAPKNFNLTFDGLVPANQAIARSLNVPAVKMLQEYGVAAFMHQLKKLGITTITKPAAHYGLSLILGGVEVTPWEIAGAYSFLGRTLTTFSTRGAYNQHDLHTLRYLQSTANNNLTYNKNSILSAASCWAMLTAMTELARPNEYSFNSTFTSLNKIAWKTGTSFGYRDAWAVGLNAKYTIVVWAGNADGEGRPGLTGIKAAAPLLFSLFNMLNNHEWFQRPKADMVAINICKETGMRLSENCPIASTIYTSATVLKSPVCSYHRLLHLDSTLQVQVNSQCYPPQYMKHKAYLMLTPVQEYFYKQRHFNYISPPAFQAGCIEDANYAKFDVVYPRNGFKIYLPVDENGNRSQLILNATHRKTESKLYWYLNNKYLGETTHIHQMAAAPTKGKQALKVYDETGKGISVYFEIIDKMKDVK